MAIVYTSDLSKTNICTLFRLLRRWHGSVFKLIWIEFLVFATLYISLSIFYHSYVLKYNNELLKNLIDYLILYCDQLIKLIPVAFVLGFYVSAVVTWWQRQYNSLPWPDDVALQICAFICGDSENAHIMRRTIVRYINLGMIIALRDVSGSARRKFPTYMDMHDAGLLNDNELNKLYSVDNSYNQYYLPLLWAGNLIKKSRLDGLIIADRMMDLLIESVAGFRQKLGDIFVNQWINPPLVYTQVATITVYGYFVAALFAWQYRDQAASFPFFGIVQFIFYVGWFRVAENLLNPFDDKDDGFDIGFLIERNIQMGYLIVDDLYRKHPDIIPDALWDFSIKIDESMAKFSKDVMDPSQVELFKSFS